MPEPERGRVRPTTMTSQVKLSAALTALGAALVLGGCGSSGPTDGGGSAASGASEPATPSEDPCAAKAATSGPALAEADLDGDGTPEEVRVTTATGDCPSALVASSGDQVLSTELETEQPPVRSAYAVDLPGRQGQLLVTRADVMRGGFQLRVYAAADGRLAELESEGRSLVPFVALDVQEHPISLDCADGRLVKTEAVAHQPVGVMAAWDVTRTTYTVEGTQVTASPAEEVADNVLPGKLEKAYPGLVAYDMFASCKAPATR